MIDDILWEAQKSIEYTVNEVADRGWVDNRIQADHFMELRNDRRFMETQVTALYEQYFLPERHEYEWQVLNEIVNTIVNSPPIVFIAGSVAGGIAGNAAYDLLKKMCTLAADLLDKKLGHDAHERSDGFKQLASDAERVKTFFVQHKKARIEEIERETGVPRERIYPLMKLAGFKHHRRDNPCFWETPS